MRSRGHAGGCSVCAERRRQEARADAQWERMARERPPAPAADDDDDFSWLFGALLAGAFALIFLLSGRLRDLRDQVEELAGEEEREEAAVGQG